MTGIPEGAIPVTIKGYNDKPELREYMLEQLNKVWLRTVEKYRNDNLEHNVELESVMMGIADDWVTNGKEWITPKRG